MYMQEEKELIVNNCVGSTGGVSLTYLLATIYDNFYWHGLGTNEDYYRLQVKKHFEKSSCCIISGHIFYDYTKIRTWGYDKVTFFTMLREPIKRIISAYFWSVFSTSEMMTYLFRKNKTPNFREWCQGFDNTQIRYIITKWDGVITEDDYKEAKERLERDYLIVGLTEQYDESLYMMYKKLNWPRLPYYGYAAGVKTNVPETISRPTAADIDYITELNKYDIKLYNHFKEKFVQSLQTLTTAEKVEMELYKNNQYKVDEGLVTLGELHIEQDKSIEGSTIIENLVGSKKNIYIFSASQGGQKIYEFIKKHSSFTCSNVTVKGFIDNNKEKHNTVIDGIRVISPTECILHADDCIVIASLSYHTAMRAMLLDLGIEEEQIVFPKTLLGKLLHNGLTKNDERRNAPFYATAEEIIPDITNRYYNQIIGKIIQQLQCIKDLNNITVYLYIQGEQLEFFLQALAKVVKSYPVKNVHWNITEIKIEDYEEELIKTINQLEHVPNVERLYLDSGEITSIKYIDFIRDPEKKTMKFSPKNIYQMEKINKVAEVDFYVVGNIMVDSKKNINQLLDSGIDLDKILELY